MSRMTSVERQELGKLVRLNAKVAKDDAEARGKWMLADAEAKLAAIYKAEDDLWADIRAAAEKQVAEADAAIAALCRQRGVPEDFRPHLDLRWYGRGENAYGPRRAELRRVAQAQVAARVKEAQVEIDRESARQLTVIAQAGLVTEEALAFIGQMPKPEELLPPMGRLQMADGKILALEAPVTPVTGPVTDEEPAATPSRNKCAFCGQPFTPSRSDARYCSDACRVKDYRRRLKAGDGQPEGK
jgi:hypothetical protein